MAITFDALDRFQENKVFKTTQIIIFLGQVKNGSLVTMETVTFKLEVQKNTCLALTLSGPRGGGLRGPDGQTHICQSETSYPMMHKLGDF